MLVYLMGIQIYDQVSILRTWSKEKLHSVVLLGFGLKESKITLNIMKVGVHCYLPNAHLNLRSNGFAKIGVKGGEIFWNILKFCVHACLSNGHSNL